MEKKESKYCGFRFSIYETNPKTGEKIHDLEEVKQKVREYSCLEDYGMLVHGRDPLTKNDIENHLNILRNQYAKLDTPKTEDGLIAYLAENQYLFEGQPKGKHLHCAMRTKKGNRRTIEQVARALGILPQEIELIRDEKKRPSGELKHFLDVVYYFTHKDEDQKDLGKAEYDWSEIEGTKDWQKEWTMMRDQIQRFGSKYNVKDAIFYAVAYEGMSIKEVRKDYPEIWIKNKDKIEKLGADYLARTAPMPSLRLNYYVDGPGGIGKNVACKALAKSLFPTTFDDECYFEVGGKNVSFEGYEGQPVVIWNDMRAIDLVMRFGRGEIFDIFDAHPTNAKHNVKYGSVRLTNAINIVNGIQPYRDFLDGLAGEYTDKWGNVQQSEDKGQAYRRFPIIMCLREQDFDVLLNRGIAEGTREYEQYIATKHLQGSFAKLAKCLEGKAKEVVTINMLSPVLDATEKVKIAEKSKISELEEIPDEFKDYGKTPEQIKIEQEIQEETQAKQHPAETYIISYFNPFIDEKERNSSNRNIYLNAVTPDGFFKKILIKEMGDCKKDEIIRECLRLDDNLKGSHYIKIDDEYHPILRSHYYVLGYPIKKVTPKQLDWIYKDIDIADQYGFDLFYGNEMVEPTDEELEELYNEIEA